MASGGWDPGPAAHSPLVCPSVRPGTGPVRRGGSERSFTVRLRGSPSARHDPHYCFRRRRSADGTALRPAPAACATPSRPRGERWGHLTVPGPHVPAPARGLQPPSATRTRTAPPCAPPATPRASRAPPRGAHGPVRPASLQPLQTHPLVDAGAGPRGARGWGVGGERHTHAWGMDCFQSRKLSHILPLNSSVTLVDLQNEIKVDNSDISISV